MNVEEDDYIDKSQEVKWDETIDEKTGKARDPLIKPERRDIFPLQSDRGGIQYTVLSCQIIITDLYERDKITSEQFKAACDYQVWRQYSAAQYSGKAAAVWWDGLADVVTEGITSFLYCLLLQRLQRADQTNIDFCLDTSVIGRHWFIERSLAQYQRSFERLLALMTCLKTDLDRARKRYPSDHLEMAKELSSLFLDRPRQK